MKKVHFNQFSTTNTEYKYIKQALKNQHISGDNIFTKKCEKWFIKHTNTAKALLTTSCTHSLEMSALLLNIKPNDEIIMPSFTFVSTANAFVLRGAKIVFVDIRPDTLNIDENKIEEAITKKTKAIIPVHYAGVSCEMDSIMNIAKQYNLSIVEDAAQGIMSYYKGRPLGTIGDMGTISFHETKNITSAGEGGLLLVNNSNYINQSDIIREKGTNRTAFYKGLVDKYSWVNVGSSYLMNDISAAFLLAQLKKAKKITQYRLSNWEKYYNNLKLLADKGLLTLPSIPSYATHNAHIFYIKLANIKERDLLLKFLHKYNIFATFHYIPLHSSIAGKKFGRFIGSDDFTTKESERLLRLPMHNELTVKEIDYVVNVIYKYFK